MVEEHPFQRKDGHALLGRTATSRDDSVDGSSEPPTVTGKTGFFVIDCSKVIGPFTKPGVRFRVKRNTPSTYLSWVTP